MAVLLDYLFEFDVGGRTHEDLDANPAIPTVRTGVTVEDFPALWTEYGFGRSEEYGMQVPVITGGTMGNEWATGTALPDRYEDFGTGPFFTPGEVGVMHYFAPEDYRLLEDGTTAPDIKPSIGIRVPGGVVQAERPEWREEGDRIRASTGYDHDGYWYVGLHFGFIHMTEEQAVATKFYVFLDGVFVAPPPGFWTNFRRCKEVK